MLPTDPISVQQLRKADLIVSAELREHHDLRPRQRGTRSPVRRVRASANAVRQRLIPTRHPAVGPFSASHDLFRALDRSQLTSLANHLEVRECVIGESLGRQGEQATRFVIVLEAQVGVTIDGVPTTVLDYGSHFGAVPLFAGGARLHRASFDALAPGLIALADPRQFRVILDEYPSIASGVYAMTRVRREYLEALEECEVSQSLGESTRAMLEYPVHLPV